MSYTTANLLTSIRRRAGLPASAMGSHSDADLLAIATEVQDEYVVPTVMRYRADHMVYRHREDLDAGMDSLRIPEDAVGNRILDIALWDAATNGWRDLTLVPSYAQDTQREVGYGTQAYYIEGSYIRFVGTPRARQLLVKYVPRPRALATGLTEYTVSAVSEALGVYTLDAPAVPSGLYDIISEHDGHQILTLGVALTNLSPTQCTGFEPDLANVAMADSPRIIPAGLTMRPNLPRDAMGLLAQATVTRVLEEMGDREGLKVALETLGYMEERFGDVASPRSESDPQLPRVRNHILGV